MKDFHLCVISICIAQHNNQITFTQCNHCSSVYVSICACVFVCVDCAKVSPIEFSINSRIHKHWLKILYPNIELVLYVVRVLFIVCIFILFVELYECTKCVSLVLCVPYQETLMDWIVVGSLFAT